MLTRLSTVSSGLLHPMSTAPPRPQRDISTGVRVSVTRRAARVLHLLRERPRLTRWVFPAVLVVVTVGLSAAGVSGTSVGVLRSSTTPGAHDPSLIAGTPRPVRSDEWNVSTPLLVGQ